MCRFICESIDDKTKQAVVLSSMAPCNFKDFQWYFRELLSIVSCVDYSIIEFR
jgi:hypothetical protein